MPKNHNEVPYVAAIPEHMIPGIFDNRTICSECGRTIKIADRAPEDNGKVGVITLKPCFTCKNKYKTVAING